MFIDCPALVEIRASVPVWIPWPPNNGTYVSYIGPAEFSDVMEWMERQDEDARHEQTAARFSRFGEGVKLGGGFLDIICQACQGEALSIVRSTIGMNGFNAWRQFVSEALSADDGSKASHAQRCRQSAEKQRAAKLP